MFKAFPKILAVTVFVTMSSSAFAMNNSCRVSSETPELTRVANMIRFNTMRTQGQRSQMQQVSLAKAVATELSTTCLGSSVNKTELNEISAQIAAQFGFFGEGHFDAKTSVYADFINDAISPVK